MISSDRRHLDLLERRRNFWAKRGWSGVSVDVGDVAELIAAARERDTLRAELEAVKAERDEARWAVQWFERQVDDERLDDGAVRSIIKHRPRQDWPCQLTTALSQPQGQNHEG